LGEAEAGSDHVIREVLKVLVFVSCFLVVGTARAEEPRRAEVQIAGPLERVTLVEQAVSEPLSRLPIVVSSSRADSVDPKTVIDRSPNAADAFVRVWIDLAVENQVTIYFVDSAWERILVRHITLERNLDDVEREEIAQIVRSSVEALLSGATIGISREEARELLLPEAKEKPPPAAVPKPKPKPRARAKPVAPKPSLEAGAFYEGELYANTLWHGPGVFAGVHTPEPLGLGGRFTLQYRAPATVEGNLLGARIQAIALRALSHVRYQSGHLGACGAAGLGADVTSTDPTNLKGNASPENARWDVVPVFRALGGGGLVFGSLGVWTVVGLDVDLIETNFTAKRGNETYTAVDVSRVRPFFGIDVTLALDAEE
jgi:hypothetical protein